MSRRKLRIIAVVIMLAVGFAAVSATLNLTGLIGINSNQDDFKVIFTSAKLNNKKRNDFIDNTKTTINFETDTLTNLDEEATLDYEVTNTSRLYDADVEINCNIVDEEEHTIESNNIVMTYEPTSMRVEAGNTKSGKIKVRLFKVATEEQSIRIKCKLNANAIERDTLGKEYVEPFSRAGTMMIAKNSLDIKENIWQYRDKINKVVFENEMIPHETNEELTFDVSENQDKSVMAYLTTLSEEEVNIYFEEYILKVTGMPLEEYKNYLTEQEGMTEEGAILTILNLKDGYFTITEADKNSYFEAYIKSETGMTLEELKKYAMEQEGMTEEEFNTEIEQMKKDTFKNWNSETLYTLYIQSDTGVKANTNSSYLFYKFSRLQEIEGLAYLETSNVTNMSHMFEDCTSILSIDFSGFNTSSTTDMSWMFDECHELRKLDLSSFNTSNVTDMSHMFAGEYDGYRNQLTSLNLSSFETSNVTNMRMMFGSCTYLTDLDLSSFDTSNVTDMSIMFRDCESLTDLDLSNFNTKEVTDMHEMFFRCSGLIDLDLSNFNTSNVTNMSDMFKWCKKLTELDLSSFDFSSIGTKISFGEMPTDAKIKVKDKVAQDWILALSSTNRPPAWNTNNVIIAS